MAFKSWFWSQHLSSEYVLTQIDLWFANLQKGDTYQLKVDSNYGGYMYGDNIAVKNFSGHLLFQLENVSW